MQRHRAPLAVTALVVFAVLSAASLAAGPRPEQVRGPVGGGKTYKGQIRKAAPLKDVAYVFRVRRRAKVTATITNTGPDVDGQLDSFNARFLNAEYDDISEDAEFINPGRTDTVSKRLRPGKYFLNLFIITDPVKFRFRLTPRRAIRNPG